MAPSGFNMSSYRAIWTHLISNSRIFEQKEISSWALVLDHLLSPWPSVESLTFRRVLEHPLPLCKNLASALHPWLPAVPLQESRPAFDPYPKFRRIVSDRHRNISSMQLPVNCSYPWTRLGQIGHFGIFGSSWDWNSHNNMLWTFGWWKTFFGSRSIVSLTTPCILNHP